MIKQLKELYPDASVDLIAGNSYGAEQVLKDSPLIDEIHFLKPETTAAQKKKFFHSLKSYQYEAVFMPFDANPHFLLVGSYLAQIKTRVRHLKMEANTWREKWRLFRQLMAYRDSLNVPITPGTHEIDLNLDLLEKYHKRPIERTYETEVSFEEDERVLRRFGLQAEQYIVIQAGCANGQFTAKSWGPFNFIKLITEIVGLPLKIVLVGDKGDQEIFIDPIMRHFAGYPNVVNTAGQTSIHDLINILNGARLVIANDSSIMHLSDALARNLIALYGPTDYTRTMPLRASSHMLCSENEYFAAMYNWQTTETKLEAENEHFNIMSALKMETVLDKVIEILEA